MMVNNIEKVLEKYCQDIGHCTERARWVALLRNNSLNASKTSDVESSVAVRHSKICRSETVLEHAWNDPEEDIKIK